MRIHTIITRIALPVTALALVTGCGVNPFGPGQIGGLKMYAILGKSVAKPQNINEEQNSKQGAKEVVAEADAAAKRLAKSAESTALRLWLDSAGIERQGSEFVYWECVTGKPSDEDPQKLLYGRSEVRFLYNGPDPAGRPGNIDQSAITDILTFTFHGVEEKTWKGEKDSVRARVTFARSGVNDVTPGFTTWWAKNITVGSDEYGDTAQFSLDSLDEAEHVQFGEGHFYDASARKENRRSWDFELQVLHKNEKGGSPYDRYQDNEGIMTFYLPWASHPDDSLYFRVHFYPDYERVGEIYKNGPDGAKLVYFEKNEKTGDGRFVMYNSDGDKIAEDSSF
jgi:hypothetical protein